MSSKQKKVIQYKNMYDRFRTGQHKGRTMKEVLEENPSYILYLNDNIGWIVFSEEIIATAQRLSAETRF